MTYKFGREPEDVSKLFDHVTHNDSDYLNGHCFASLMPYVPMWSNRRTAYLAIPLGHHMRQKKQSKPELAAAMVCQVIPSFASQRNIVILYDSWYVKKNLACIVDEYPNLDLIYNARADFVIYDLAPQPTSRRDEPVKHGERFSAKEDFTLSVEKIRDYYTGVRWVLTNIFGQREIPVYSHKGHAG